MITIYQQYNELNRELGDFIDTVNNLRYRYYASELLKKMIESSDINLDLEVRRAIAICRLAGIPVQEHFTCIYRSHGSEINRDWKLSELACSFIILSHEPENEMISEIQEAFICKLGL